MVPTCGVSSVVKVYYQSHERWDVIASGGERGDPVHQIISASPCAPEACDISPILAAVVGRTETPMWTLVLSRAVNFGFASRRSGRLSVCGVSYHFGWCKQGTPIVSTCTRRRCVLGGEFLQGPRVGPELCLPPHLLG